MPRSGVLSWVVAKHYTTKDSHVSLRNIPHKFQLKLTRRLTQTHQDTQVISKAHLRNVMDVLGRLTSKLNQTSHTA